MGRLCRAGLHNLDAPEALDTRGSCRECARTSQRKYNASPSGKRRTAYQHKVARVLDESYAARHAAEQLRYAARHPERIARRRERLREAAQALPGVPQEVALRFLKGSL